MTDEYEELRRRGVSAFVHETRRDEYWRALALHRRSYLGADGLARSELVEEASCAACGGADASEAFLKDGFRYLRCRCCGSLYISPQLTAEQLDDYWRTSPVARQWAEVLSAPAQVAFDRAKYVRALEWVEARRGSPGSALDIGCSTGLFLEVARERQWDVAGVEPGDSVRAQALERGVHVVADIADLDAGDFDLVTFWEVVEHTKSPLATLDAAVARLAPDGLLVTLVGGNAHAFANRVLHESSAAFDFSRLWYFSPASYAILLDRAGLRQLEYRSVIAELDTTLNYLRYDDPYAPLHDEQVLPPDLLRRLEEAILGGDLGYKFLSLARRSSARESAATNSSSA